MPRKTKITACGSIPRTHKTPKLLRARRTKLRVLLQAGYMELGSQARRLAREFARLEADPVLKALWKNERDAAYDRL